MSEKLERDGLGEVKINPEVCRDYCRLGGHRDPGCSRNERRHRRRYCRDAGPSESVQGRKD